MNSRGAIPLVLLGALALVGVGLAVFRPRALHGDSRRAAASVAASARVEQATTAPAAAAAASVAKIAEANAMAPDSPARDFIGKEAQVALANLPPPDPAALLAAEQRRSAVMEGQRDEARRLYADALKRADELARERAAAVAARAKVDSELSEVAAARLAAESEGNRWKVLAAVVVLLWLYVKLTHFSPGALASALNDIRAGVHPVQALDTVASRLQQGIVSRLAKKP